MSNKKILTLCLVIACVLLGVMGLGAWIVYKIVAPFWGPRYQPPETPAALSKPRIVVGAEFLSRNQLITTSQTASIDTIEDLAVGELDSNPGIDIVIAGRSGAIIVDRNGTKQSEVYYEFEVKQVGIGPLNSPSLQTLLGDVQVIDIEGDGSCEYLARGSVDGAALFSHEGKRLWSYGAFTDEKTSIDDLAVGDINGDGVSEFIAAWNGLEFFDRHGNKLGAQKWEGSLHQIEVVDVDGDRKNEIIHSNGSGLIIRDGQGQIIKEVEMPFYLSTFDLCAMPGEERPQILALADENIWITDFDGKVVEKFAASLSKFARPAKKSGEEPGLFDLTDTSVYKAKGVWVKLKEDKPAYLAVVTEFAAIDRSVLYVYSAKGRLVYQEVMPEACTSIAVLSPADGPHAQELLVGGSQTVWRYTAGPNGP